MSEQSHKTIRFQYKKGNVKGGYSFSSNNSIIILSDYVNKLENDRVREAIHFEAKRTRHHYVIEVNKLKTLGEEVNTFYAKRDATAKAKSETQTKFPDVWHEVEKIYNSYEFFKTSPEPSTATIKNHDDIPCNLIKGIKFILKELNSNPELWTSTDYGKFFADLIRIGEVT